MEATHCAQQSAAHVARVAGLENVFIDTSELFPFTIMDLLLTLSEDLLFTWVWTDELLDEWERVIVEHGHRTPESARSVSAAVRGFFAEQRITPDLYRTRITDDLSPGPTDRVHAAACVFGSVNILLTKNAKHFQARRLAEAGVQVMNADDYLCILFERHPDQVAESIRRAAAAKTDPVVTVDDMIEQVSHAGAHRFAIKMRTYRSGPIDPSADRIRLD